MNLARVFVRPAASMSIRGLVSPARSQSLFVLCRSSSSSSSACHRIWRSVGSTGERLRIPRLGIGRNFGDGLVISGGGLGTNRLPLVSPFLTKGLSSAEASALTDGFLKESLVKDGEEKAGAPLAAAAADGETGKALLTDVAEVEEEGGRPPEILSAAVEEVVRERHTLVAEIKSLELELAEKRSALRLVDEKHGVEVNGSGGSASRVAPGFPEVGDSAEAAAASQVSVVLEEAIDDLVRPPSETVVTLAEGLASDSSALDGIENLLDEPTVAALAEGLASESSALDGIENLLDEPSTVAASHTGGEDEPGSESIAHPWPEWLQFLKQLEQGGHFVTEEKTAVDMNGSTNDDVGLIKRACLNFARERDDVFLHYSRKDLEVIARFGCPCTDRKVVNAGKRLRDFLAIDEISVCRPCALRESCERRDFKANAVHVAGTPEVLRLLTQYALEVSPYAKEGLNIPSAVQAACINLLKETAALGAVPRDPGLPKIERATGDTPVKSDRRERESRRKVRDVDVEMKPGDWKCEECQYVNFARNRACRECDAFRPVPEMRPGDWRCPECSFVNFSRNDTCYDCKADKPAGSGYKSSYDTGSRYDRGAPAERGSRFDRGDRRSDVRSFDRGSERNSRDSDRGGSDRYDSRGGDRESFGGRARERGSLERRSASDDARGGRRSNFEEWKPDLKKRGDFEDEEEEEEEPKARRSALEVLDDDDGDEDDDDDLEFDSDEDISDVEPLEDGEFEDMRPAASANRGRGDSGRDREVVRSRVGGRNDDKDPWWEDDRRGGTERRNGTGGMSVGSGRGGRSGGRGSRGGGGRGGRGDFGRERRSSSPRDSRPPSYERYDRDSRAPSYERSDRDSRAPSYERSDRDSGRSYGRSDREFDRPSRGRGGGGRGRGGGGRGRGRR